MLETERLCLRPPTSDDAHQLVEQINHELIADTTLNIPHPYSIDDAHAFIEKQQEKEDPITSLNLAFFLKDKNRLIGGVGLMDISSRHRHAEIGYWCGINHWNKGYTTEAASRVLRYCFEELGLVRVHAICLVRNAASAAVLRKIGMAHEGIARREYQKNGIYEDYHHFAIIKPDIA